MESFRDRGDEIELGGWEAPRLKVGRSRILQQATRVPLDKLVRMEMSDFQGPDVYALYSQSACLCHFFMHYDAGRYRDAFVKYLEQVYLGKADPMTLAELTATEYARLDEQFLNHLTASVESAGSSAQGVRAGSATRRRTEAGP
jgi:hypothetical protein